MSKDKKKKGKKVEVEPGDEHDKNQGDKIKVGNVSGTGIAIGRGASSKVSTGETFNMSGDFRGSILNIKSKLENVTQRIESMPHGDEATKSELLELISTLKMELQKVPEDKTEDAEAVADLTEKLVENAVSKKPNKKVLQITGEGLKQAAQNIADVMPTVLSIATKIVSAIGLLAA